MIKKYKFELVMRDKSGKRRSFVSDHGHKIEEFYDKNRVKAKRKKK